MTGQMNDGDAVCAATRDRAVMNLSHDVSLKSARARPWLATSMQEVIGLFPTPFMRAPRVLGRRLVAGLVEHFSKTVDRAEQFVAEPRRTPRCCKPERLAAARGSGGAADAAAAGFGALLFGERLGWSLKEMWVNVLDTGGRQAMHNHANSFISGVVYLTPTHRGRAHGVHEVARRHRLRVQERPRRRDHRARTTRTSGSARRPSPATWCCSPAT